MDKGVGKYVHKCSFCSYCIADLKFMQAAHDFPCPRCGKRTLSEFNMYEDIAEDSVDKYEEKVL